MSVPVKPHPLADPEKGSGIAMICTFGDITDVTWWRELSLPVRAVILPNGAFRPIDVGRGRAGSHATQPRPRPPTTSWSNLSAVKARTEVVELLQQSGDLIGEPRPITHPVKFYEKGDRPLEIITSRQWFIKTMDFRDELLARGRELQWHPEYMRHRYENWVNGLAGDWCVSRQRFFGVPFPVWYPITADGSRDYTRPIVPDESRLPIDPSTDLPDGYTADQRDRPNGFAGDPDVMDTWATSSLTPQVAGGWLEDPDLFARVFPMDLRPQAHDIIRTWLFSTVLRSELEHRQLPWAHTAISGFVVDPDRKKMSKSKGNVVTPLALLEEHGSDGVRYWAASGRSGTDTTFDPGADEGRPPPGDEAAERRPLRADAGRAAWGDHRAARSRNADRARGTRRRVNDAARGLRLRTRARADGDVLLGVLRRLSRAGEEPAVRRFRAGRRGVGEQRHARRACRPCCGCSRHIFRS